MFSLSMADSLQLDEVYSVSKDGYATADTKLGNMYGSEGFKEIFHYDGDDLGALYSPSATSFRLWAPTAAEASLNIFDDGEVKAGDASVSYEMAKDVNGTWTHTIDGDIKNKYYTYTVTVNGIRQEAVDPYAKALGVNGKRGMVINLSETNPEGWDSDARPPFVNMTDAIIYELHVRDFSTSPTSGIENTGKFLAFTETGTVSPSGEKTGVDHLTELGITHLHLLPSFDFKSIDETTLELNNFNWGYDPENYNAPEGSYSTDPYNGAVRVTEFKRMVKSLHDNGIRVVMDVVYNHTGATNDSNLNLLVPDYYYRQNTQGGFSNGSGCGNETASERSMVRKFIVDSVVYWAEEYHIDGFRFDLMGLHDIETMNEVRAALNEVDPSILIYGEGWTGGSSPLDSSEAALKANASLLDEHIAVFSDDMRDGIKGSVFNDTEPGYVNGPFARREDVKFGVVASVTHPQLDYDRISCSSGPWAKSPAQTITYASAHDNLSLWDKLIATNPKATEDELIAMNKLSAAIVLTSQGIPFFQAGEEFARTKCGDENSYQSPDSVNQINWENKTNYKKLFNYYKGLIDLRKAHPAFRMNTADEIANNITFISTESQLLAYTISNNANGDDADTIAVIFNVSKEERNVTLPQAGWDIVVDGDAAGTTVLGQISTDMITVGPKSTRVLIYTGNSGATITEGKTSPTRTVVIGGIAAAVVLASAAGIWYCLSRKKRRN